MLFNSCRGLPRVSAAHVVGCRLQIFGNAVKVEATLFLDSCHGSRPFFEILVSRFLKLLADSSLHPCTHHDNVLNRNAQIVTCHPKYLLVVRFCAWKFGRRRCWHVKQQKNRKSDGTTAVMARLAFLKILDEKAGSHHGSVCQRAPKIKSFERKLRCHQELVAKLFRC